MSRSQSAAGAGAMVHCPGNAAPVFLVTADGKGHVRREIPGGFLFLPTRPDTR